jgi:hypothetical protein
MFLRDAYKQGAIFNRLIIIAQFIGHDAWGALVDSIPEYHHLINIHQWVLVATPGNFL